MGWDKIKSMFNRKAAEPTWKDARRDFFKALRRQDTERLSELVQKYPEALDWNKGEGAPLMMALKRKKMKSFRHLVALGARMTDDVLTHAAKHGKAAYVEFMLEQGARPSSAAQIYASVYKHHEIADMIKRGDKIRAEYLARQRAEKEKKPAAQDDGKVSIKVTVTNPPKRF
ncbi:MAG: hypothetical protein GC185_12245 [Alphaproteobacteria bacterium]|nr:hypothetical protein [Alphaproteobacteria bacterium]